MFGQCIRGTQLVNPSNNLTAVYIVPWRILRMAESYPVDPGLLEIVNQKVPKPEDVIPIIIHDRHYSIRGWATMQVDLQSRALHR
jgi:hypothetical protein